MTHHNNQFVQTRRISIISRAAVLVGLAAGFAPLAAAKPPEQSDAEASLQDNVVPSGIVSPQRPIPAEPVTPSAEGGPDQSIFGRDTLTGNWWGARTKLEEMGIIPAASFTSDSAMNFRGGQNTEGSSFLHLTDVNLTLLPPFLPFEGSTIFLSFQTVNGTSASEDVGDLSGVSTLDSEGRTQLSEIWYQQMLADGRFGFTIGKIDAGSVFGIVDPEGYFLNSRIGFQDSQPLPTYPDPSFGGYITFKPEETLTVDAGIFDGAYQEDVRTGNLGPKTLFDDPSDLYTVAQVTWNTTDKLTLGGGGWYHTGTFADQFGNDQDGAYGAYIHGYYQLCKELPDDENDNQGLALFAHYAYADPTASDVPHHIGAGALWVGALPGRDSDVAGFGITTLLLRDGPEFSDGNETAYELFYKIQLTPYLSIQPDLQYVSNPGGNGASDAIVGTIRLSVDF